MNCEECDRLLNYIDMLDDNTLECPTCGHQQPTKESK